TNKIFIAGNIQPPTSTSSAYMDSSPSTGQEQNINRLIALYYSALRASLSMFKMLRVTRRNSPKVRARPVCFPFKSIADLLEFNNATDNCLTML
ncbi:unnamed protein product, partial [Arctia plantaginis]